MIQSMIQMIKFMIQIIQFMIKGLRAGTEQCLTRN